ncbi:hypothetical protein GCM10023185_00700 [Hymenobacter saemangeumensis]|uniref:T9SS type A sorting domain-containing protein n=1 Tax=Hymenobacter saemangeumensis TaxID=1084522 RepID=A0ABP8HWQ4_9BACT
MKHLFHFLALLALGLGSRATHAQAPTFDYAVTCASGDGRTTNGWGPTALVADRRGNTYVAGQFEGTIALGNTLLSVSPSFYGVFVAKLDVAGNYVWAVQINDGQQALASALTVDSVGGVYLVGTFRSHSVQFGPGGPVLFNSSANNEGFVAKFDAASGQCSWARRVGGTGPDELNKVVVGPAGDLYVLGSVATATTAGPFPLAGPMVYLAKLNPAGTWLWARSVGAGAEHLAIDAQGDLYVAGSFSSTASFGAITLTTRTVPGSYYDQYGHELFVAKTNDAGAWLWAVQGDAVTQRNIIFPFSLAYDGSGHLYVGGYYVSAAARIGATVMPNLSARLPSPPNSPVYYPNNYGADAFVARLDAGTGQWDWAVRNGGVGNEGVVNTVADARGQLHLTGNLLDPTPNAGRFQFARLDGATGTWQGFFPLDTVYVTALALDGRQRLNMAGGFHSRTVRFGPHVLASAGPGTTTGFVARAAATPLATTRPTAQGNTGLQLWPNPAQGAVWVQGPPSGQRVTVLDVLGRPLGEGTMPAAGPLRLPLALSPGLYLVRAGQQLQRLVLE